MAQFWPKSRIRLLSISGRSRKPTIDDEEDKQPLVIAMTDGADEKTKKIMVDPSTVLVERGKRNEEKKAIRRR